MPTKPDSQPLPSKAELLKTLGDPLRLNIVSLLAPMALCTTHLIQETGARQTTVSNHLRILREAGVVEALPHGRYTYYRVRPEALTPLTGLLGSLARSAEETIEADRRRPCA
ncbi:ArsR/SmtB family transcription factor [Streptomyces sp. NPDC018964]|uniref:ArsR/SmtB family transcription factor n=1 Tax=Streptomyces sp. NPDC018964 TaxID=3365058 RepID=UPI0037B28506